MNVLKSTNQFELCLKYDREYGFDRHTWISRTLSHAEVDIYVASIQMMSRDKLKYQVNQQFCDFVARHNSRVAS